MEEIYNQFSKEYNDLFLQNIHKFFDKCKKGNIEDNEYALFYPSFGVKKNETCEFLILGQAVNGWSPSIYTGNESVEDTLLQCAIEYSNSFCKTENHTPLDWVNVRWSKSTLQEHLKNKIKSEFYKEEENNYYLYKSFFWNVTYKLISSYYKFDPNSMDWSKKLVWSNLYKIAPVSGNPSEYEKELQQDLSIKLLKKEIEELKPKFCIVLTNDSWWEPFQSKLNISKLHFDSNLTEIVFHEKHMDTRIIVTTRPFIGSSEKHVNQILQLINTNV